MRGINERSLSPVTGSESPSFHDSTTFSFSGRGLLSPVVGSDGGFQDARNGRHQTANEISAPYEVPQFPIEEIERKLAIQRQLTLRYHLRF